MFEQNVIAKNMIQKKRKVEEDNLSEKNFRVMIVNVI